MAHKKLHDILNSVHEHTVVCGSADVEVSSITLDSREVVDGSLFIARRGGTVDGHRFIKDAIEHGAVSAVGEIFTDEQVELARNKNVTLVRVKESLHDGGVMVAAFYDFPFTKMTMVGVTGTDGKTTTTNAVYDILKSLGKKVGLISTVSAKVFDGRVESEMDTGLHVTTPEVTEIQRLLAKMVEQGCEYAIVEATSHGFAQGRLAGINFDVVGITNITHEHTDYHGAFENYLAAKAKIFQIDSDLPRKEVKRIGYLNADDPKSVGFREFAEGWDIRTYSIDGHGILNAEIERTEIKGTQFVISGHTYETSLVGKYNVSNITLALGMCHALGFAFEEMVASVKEITSPPGRFEVIDAGAHGTVVIDFAHTPNAMEQVVSFVRNHSKGTLIVVFGCAGLRDVEKRPMMGRIAGRLADWTIVTAEDPRTETVRDISDQIIAGLEAVGTMEAKIQAPIINDSPNGDLRQIITNNQLSNNTTSDLRTALYDERCYSRIEDRFEAIKAAILAAGKNDVVMILGKGHEKSMCFGTTEVPWSDREAVEKVLKEYN